MLCLQRKCSIKLYYKKIKMDKKCTNIKERVIFFAKTNGFSIEPFLLSIGMTYGSFKGKAKEGTLNSEAIAKILTNHPTINLEWLLTGNGEPLKKSKTDILNSEKTTFKEELSSHSVELLKKDLETAIATLESQKDMIDLQKDFINNLKAEIELLRQSNL